LNRRAILSNIAFRRKTTSPENFLFPDPKNTANAQVVMMIYPELDLSTKLEMAETAKGWPKCG
jgi:hypothetical protein